MEGGKEEGEFFWVCMFQVARNGLGLGKTGRQGDGETGGRAVWLLGDGHFNKPIGAFFQLFETLPQPLPELREGGYIVFLSGMLSEYSSGFLIGTFFTGEQSKGS